MNEEIILVILIIFPILIYLLFSALSILVSKKISKIFFIVTIFTSLYLCISFHVSNITILFSSIPILICYLKKENILGVILSLIVFIYCYLENNSNIEIITLNLIVYYIIYIFTNRYNYLYLKIIGIWEGIFLIILYFMNISNVLSLILYMVVIDVMIFISLYLFKIADNVTNLYETLNEMKKENILKDSLFKLTHEIKNPLAVCKGYLDMFNVSDIDKSRKYINIIRSEIDRSLNIMADFMEYSKIKINKEEIDLNMLLESVNESFFLLNNNIKFNYENNYEEIYINVDYERIKQVLVNVIKNSIESIENNGIIDMKVLISSGMVSISILDNGIGMDELELENLFKMFYTTKKNGTGLGIALSKEIMDAHNGSISYESRKGVGTKCIISIPIN